MLNDLKRKINKHKWELQQRYKIPNRSYNWIGRYTGGVQKQSGWHRSTNKLEEKAMKNTHTEYQKNFFEWKEVRTQDDRVEGRALNPSFENTRITANWWKIINRKTLELSKKDTAHAKTKEKPQWDDRRGAITIKSNPITAGWVTHKQEDTNTTEVHPLDWRFWATRQTSQPGGLAMGGGIPRESDFEG